MGNFVQLGRECTPAAVYLGIGIIGILILVLVLLSGKISIMSGLIKLLVNIIVILLCTKLIAMTCSGMGNVVAWLLLLCLLASNITISVY